MKHRKISNLAELIALIQEDGVKLESLRFHKPIPAHDIGEVSVTVLDVDGMLFTSDLHCKRPTYLGRPAHLRARGRIPQ